LSSLVLKITNDSKSIIEKRELNAHGADTERQ